MRFIKLLLLSLFSISVGFFLFQIKSEAASKISGSVHNELVGTFSRQNTSEATLQNLKKIAQDDNHVKILVTSDAVVVSENLGYSSNFHLRVQNHLVHVQHGKFVTSVHSKQFSHFTVSDTGTGTTRQKLKNGRNLNVVNKISYGQMIDTMDSMNNVHSQKSKRGGSLFFAAISNLFILTAEAKSNSYHGQKNGHKVKTGTHVHCNRFNGTHSNHRYYKRQYPQSFVNYYKSDCWYKHKAYHCPFTKHDYKCNGLSKHHAHDCSVKGHWPVTCWYRN